MHHLISSDLSSLFKKIQNGRNNFRIRILEDLEIGFTRSLACQCTMIPLILWFISKCCKKILKMESLLNLISTEFRCYGLNAMHAHQSMAI